jgi:hypothetical protein
MQGESHCWLDITEPNARLLFRSRYLLIAQGLGALGRAPAFVLGPMLAKIFGNPLSVFYTSSAALALSALVAAIFVPESLSSKYLSPSSRNEDSAPSEPQALSSHSTRQRSTSSTRKKRVENDEGWSWRSLIAPLTLLQTMMPSRSAPSEPLRYRLLLLSVALFFGHMVTTFLVQGALVYAVTIFNFDSQQVCQFIAEIDRELTAKSDGIHANIHERCANRMGAAAGATALEGGPRVVHLAGYKENEHCLRKSSRVGCGCRAIVLAR